MGRESEGGGKKSFGRCRRCHFAPLATLVLGLAERAQRAGTTCSLQGCGEPQKPQRKTSGKGAKPSKSMLKAPLGAREGSISNALKCCTLSDLDLKSQIIVIQGLRTVGGFAPPVLR